ncbi:hypothetical protein [Plantactinospora sonchi]|uniref:DUF2029 domain-containing protein n=1 Tax=Plantactinospora sonchi TaxID=1544735 RepID=A0ABU7RMN5_9ACTN
MNPPVADGIREEEPESPAERSLRPGPRSESGTERDTERVPGAERNTGSEAGRATGGAGRRPAGRTTALLEWALIGVGMVVLAVTPRKEMIGDGLARYYALVGLLEQQKLSDTAYSLIGPLFATPLWFVGRWTDDTQAVVAQYNFLLFTLGLMVIHILLHKRIDDRLLRRFLLLLIAGSMIGAHLQDFYGEVFTTVTVGVGLLAATLPWTGRWTRIGGWVAVVLGVANTPATLLALGLVVGLLCLRRRRLRYLAVPLVTVLLMMGEAWLRFGDPLHSVYLDNGGGRTVMPYSGEPGFSYPFLLGVVAILFSFGRGLLWFTPGLFLPIRRRLREEGGAAGDDVWSFWLLWAVFVAGLVLVYASWWAWYGGMYWGPRFFLFAILPACLALAVCLSAERAGPWANLATLAAVLLSVWGAANSLVYGQVRPLICYDNNWYLEALCHFTPEFSPLWAPLMEAPPLTGLQRLALAGYALVLLWFSVPLLARLARQAGTAVRDHRQLLGWRNWRW